MTIAGVRSMRSTDIRWSAILSWGYADHVLRLKSRQSEPPVSFLQCSPLYQVRQELGSLVARGESVARGGSVARGESVAGGPVKRSFLGRGSAS